MEKIRKPIEIFATKEEMEDFIMDFAHQAHESPCDYKEYSADEMRRLIYKAEKND